MTWLGAFMEYPYRYEKYLNIIDIYYMVIFGEN